jgi:hypothetical protein
MIDTNIHTLGALKRLATPPKASKPNSATTFMSKIISSPDLDKINVEKDPEVKETII